MEVLHRLISCYLEKIDHDFYSFHMFGEAGGLSLAKRRLGYAQMTEREEKELGYVISNNKKHYISTYPNEWQNLYISQGYFQIDPVVSKSSSRFHPFHWGEGYFSSEDINSAEKKQFIKNAQDFNIYQGITVPLGDHRKTRGVITLTFKKKTNIGDATFFCITSYLRSLGYTIFKLHDYYEGKKELTPEDQLELFKFLKDNHQSCTSFL